MRPLTVLVININLNSTMYLCQKSLLLLGFNVLDVDFSGTNKWEELTYIYKGEKIPYFEGHSFVTHKVCYL